MNRFVSYVTWSCVSCLAGSAAALAQGPAIDEADLHYWPPSERSAYAAYERSLNEIPSPQRLRSFHDLIASKPHIAGTQGDREVVDAIARTFGGYGLEVEVHPFWALLPMPIDAALEVVTPERIVCELREEAIEGDPYSDLDGLTFGWNAYSGSGDVTAEVVYANYGRKEDFAKLAQLGVSCEGKVVICRYGGNYRGYKAKFAEQAGAAALVIYTDPQQSGFVQGDEYPEGGYQTPGSIQRGSIVTLPYAGDPLTPFVEATEDAVRLDPDEIALPRIPVQPVGWGAAQSIMSRMTGEAVPEGWAGGMPLDYVLTGGPDLTVRVMVKQERKIRKTFNVIGTLVGATEPERVVLIGAHQDAWSCGAADSTSGMICVLESARTFSTMAAKGVRPARTIKFCAWGAEEFGIIGSAEWIEGNRDALLASAVGYINLDMAPMGPNFGSSASPSLRTLIAECSRSVPQARDAQRSVYEAWFERGEDDLTPGSPNFGDMGGGSDHVGFVCHIGVASCSLGGSGSKGNSYHTNYDNLAWYRKVVGEDYEPALMVTRMAVSVASRLANAPLVPLDPARAAKEFSRHSTRIATRGEALGFFEASGSDGSGRFAEMEAEADEQAAKVAAYMADVAALIEAGRLSKTRLARTNAAVVGQDRLWLVEGGIPGRPWFRSMYAAPDEDSGYASWMLPSLRYAIEHQDEEVLTWVISLYEDKLRHGAEVFEALHDRLKAERER
jgi:N-acetylated-alpha-linked acidic dipeptidase